MAGPNQVIETAIYTTLAADSTLISHLGGTAIFEGVAPTAQALPVVIFNWQGGGDQNLTPGRQRNPVFQVKCISGSKAQAGTIDGDIDRVLHHATLTISGYTNFWTAREDDVAFDEVNTGGSVLYHRGGLYRIRVTQ